MRLKRVTAIVLVGLILVLFLASFNSLNSNFQPVYTQVYYHGIIQKDYFPLYPTNTDSDFEINIGYGKIISEIKITLTSIIAPNKTITPENKYDTYKGLHQGYFYAMCFNITSSGYLYSVSLNLRALNDKTLNITIREADENATPSTYIYSTTHFIENGWDGWREIQMNHIFLEKTSTNKGVFFVCIKQTATPTFEVDWYTYQDTSSSENYGPAYTDSGGSWLLVTPSVDFDLKVNISSSASYPFDVPDPKNISLTINGYNSITSAKNSSSFRLFDVKPLGPIAFFDVSSPWDEMTPTNPPISFIVEANYTVVSAPVPIIDFSFLTLALGLMGSSQGGGFLLFFGGGGLVAAVVGLVGGLAFVRTRRRKHLLNALRKLSRIMAVNVSGVNVFDFPLSEDESGADATLIAASISAVSTIEAEADTRESKITGRRDWFTTDKRIFFNMGSSEVVVNETERSIFDGWWIGGVFDEPLSDEERNQVRRVIKSLGDEAVRLARLDSKVYNNLVQWNGQTRIFKEFYLQVLNNGLTAVGLSIDRVMELRLQGIQKLKMIFKLTEMGSSLLIENMLSSLENFDSAVICFNLSREMWVKDVKNFLDLKQVKKLEKSAQDKEALLYSAIKGESVGRIQAAFVYLMLLMKKLASRNLKLDVIFFGLPPEYKDTGARRTSAKSLEESKIKLENIDPSDPKTWDLFTQTLFDIVSRGEVNSSVKMEFESILKEIELCLKGREEVEATATIIFTAGGLNTSQIIKMVKSQKLTNIYTLLIGAPQEEKIQIPAQFIPIPAVSEENIKPFTEDIT
ncbi:MAG: hypothetical protein ACETWM_01500 [Candidatus Lokiarchaeia archaeon]